MVPIIPEREEVLRQIAALNVWKRGEERVPHKPLLILLALGRLRNSAHPEYPSLLAEDRRPLGDR